MWKVRCLRLIKKMATMYLDVVDAMETAYMEVEPWFRNTVQQEAAELSGKPENGSGIGTQP